MLYVIILPFSSTAASTRFREAQISTTFSHKKGNVFALSRRPSTLPLPRCTPFSSCSIIFTCSHSPHRTTTYTMFPYISATLLMTFLLPALRSGSGLVGAAPQKNVTDTTKTTTVTCGSLWQKELKNFGWFLYRPYLTTFLRNMQATAPRNPILYFSSH